MMDFLRRLAPSRGTDATRAVAVLPSRFASESPLRAMIGQARPALRPDEDRGAISLDVTWPPSATDALATQGESVTGVESSQTALQPPDMGPTARHYAKTTSSTRAPAPGMAGSELQSVAALLAASQGLRSVAAPAAQTRVSPPLSQSILEQRTLQSRDDSQVVHVSIGRIDVVANTAPAPAVRRSPTPRQTVTLADYLRGGDGSRR